MLKVKIKCVNPVELKAICITDNMLLQLVRLTQWSGLNSYCDNKVVSVSGQGVTIEATEVCDDIDIYAEELESYQEDNEVE